MKINKLLFSLFLVFCLVLSVQAQAPQIRLKGEKILVNNQLYGYLIKSGSAWARDYSFQSTRNEELAFARAVTKEMPNGHVYDYYEITFKGFSQKAEMDMDNDFGRRFAFEMVLDKMVKNNLLDPESVEKFLARYPANISKRLSSNL
ncbi:hypothetical protein [Adhaeribacter soli]|uniref:Uncharacterized protein n=1 Tax=Adhaeribacter soli TaxID=2607655 RepID=A0A5N1IVE9_9BACT|nr:hypothetical protein [Adhaeribacter soli]KAA9331909.1 hypothetical protein F0P94_14010 [Adhaeribacter soli]